MRLNSASQIELWLGCRRAWAIRYLLKWIVQAWSAKFGERLHTLAERYMLTGTHPDPLEKQVLAHPGYPDKTKTVYSTFLPGLALEHGLHLMPTPMSGKAEGQFFLQLARSKWQGYKDYGVAPEQSREGYPEVWDWKSSGDIYGDYVKTPDKLIKDPAALLYAADAMVKYGSDIVDLYWVYFRRISQEGLAKKKHKLQSRQIYLRIVRDDVEKGLDFLDQVGAQVIEAHAAKLPIEAYEQNPRHCKAYGGCPYANSEHCQLTDQQKVISLMSQPLSFEEMMQAQGIVLGGSPAPAPAPPIPPIPAPPLPPVQATKRDPLDVAEEDGWIRHPGAPGHYYRGQEVKPDLDLVGIYAERAGHTIAGAVGINPPENPGTHVATPEAHPNAGAPREESAFASVQTLPVAGQPALTDRYSAMSRDELKKVGVDRGLIQPQSKVRDDGLRDMLRKSDAMGLPLQAMPVPTAGAPAIPAPPSIPVPPPAPALLSMPVPPPAPVVRPTAPQLEMHPSIAPGAVKGFYLYINCRPVASPKLLEATDIINQAHMRVCTNNSIPDYRFADYGKGKGLLAVELGNVLREVGPRLSGCDIVIDVRTDLGRDAVDVLRQFAGKIVQGF